MNEDDRRRYHSVLAEIASAPGIGLTMLQRELEFTHGIVASGARLRADLALLADAGLVRWDGAGALLTERGLDVARQRVEMPVL
jgi:hypothetical protein